MTKTRHDYMGSDDILWYVNQPMGEGIVLSVSKYDIDDAGNPVAREWVTHRFDGQDSSNRYWGHYHRDFRDAVADFTVRTGEIEALMFRNWLLVTDR